MTTPEQAAEAYCDQPRCAQMTRDDKAWHRTKAAFLAGIAYRDQNPSESVRGLVDECVRLKFVLEGGMPRLPETPDSYLERFLKALATYREQAGEITNEKA